MSLHLNRRRFLQSGAAGSAVLFSGAHVFGEEKKASDSPNNKLNIALIGVGGMGGGNHNGVMSENIVAICDIDESILDAAAKKSPKAKKFKDFRKLLDECGKEIDAVVVSTPDNTHAVAAVRAMNMGKHCYCEKPLTHDLYEARVMRETAAKMKVKTQMGNRGTVEPGFRRGVELLQAGVIGPVTEVHIWSNRPIWPQGMAERPPASTAPAHIDWDLWLGPAPERPYSGPQEPGKRGPYHTFAWRGWWDFGTGALGDMACHTANQAFMGLKLGHPTSFHATKTDGVTKESPPPASTIEFQFPARGPGFPALKLVWYDGTGKGNLPPESVLEHVKKMNGGKVPGSGAIFLGEKGRLFAPDDYATKYILDPTDLMDAAKAVPESLPRFKGNHYQEWIASCKGEIPQAMSNFDYAGRLTEFVLLGNLAVRTGKKIEWDGEGLKAKNAPEAEELIRREYRKGWSL